METSEFPLAMAGSDASAANGTAAVMSGGRPMRADKAASEEQPGSLNVDPRPEGGGE
jgi:multicomponent Na+:H+ antiporter subunit C